MPRPDNSRPKQTAVAVDFTGVVARKGGGGGLKVQPGDYLLKVEDVEVKDNRNGGGQHVAWQLSIVKGPEVKAGRIVHRTSLKPEQLWNLKGFLEDIRGSAIEQKALKLDFAKYVGKTVGATLQDGDPWTNPDTGKTTVKSEIGFTYPASDFKEDAPDASDDDDDDTQDVDATDSDDDDEDELETIDDDD